MASSTKKISLGRPDTKSVSQWHLTEEASLLAGVTVRLILIIEVTTKRFKRLIVNRELNDQLARCQCNILDISD
jgi:hypothetical protein